MARSYPPARQGGEACSPIRREVGRDLIADLAEGVGAQSCDDECAKFGVSVNLGRGSGGMRAAARCKDFIAGFSGVIRVFNGTFNAGFKGHLKRRQGINCGSDLDQ